MCVGCSSPPIYIFKILFVLRMNGSRWKGPEKEWIRANVSMQIVRTNLCDYLSQYSSLYFGDARPIYRCIRIRIGFILFEFQCEMVLDWNGVGAIGWFVSEFFSDIVAILSKSVFSFISPYSSVRFFWCRLPMYMVYHPPELRPQTVCTRLKARVK